MPGVDVLVGTDGDVGFGHGDVDWFDVYPFAINRRPNCIAQHQHILIEIVINLGNQQAVIQIRGDLLQVFDILLLLLPCFYIVKDDTEVNTIFLLIAEDNGVRHVTPFIVGLNICKIYR